MDYSSSPAFDGKGSHYNYISNTSQQYQQEFWKLKYQKVSNSNEDLLKENKELNKRIIDMSRIEQELREKLMYYQDDWKNRSRKLTTERASDKMSDIYTEDKLTSTNELERLYKEIRIIKNTHQVEETKLKEENKKLRKQVETLSQSALIAKNAVEEIKKLKKNQEEVSQLKRRLSSNEEALNRARDEKGKLMSQNEELRKSIQEIKFLQAMKQKEEEEKLLTYRKKLDQMSQGQTYRKDLTTPRDKQQKQAQSMIPLFSRREEQSSFLSLPEESEKAKEIKKQNEQEVQKLKRQIEQYQKLQISFEDKLKFEQSNLQNEKFKSQIKVKKLEGDLLEAQAELSNVLRKLSPLLEKKWEANNTNESADTFASMSILQIYLKKYKIQAF